MKINWLGHSCFKITNKEGKTLLFDPYKDMLGYKLPKDIEADIVLTSHDHYDHNYIEAVKGEFIHINKIGDFNEDSIHIRGVATYHDKFNGSEKGNNILFTVEVDGLKVCHCGDLGHILDELQIKEIGKVDILLVPVGGGYTIGAEDAVEVVKQLNPKVIIPMHYRTKALGVFGLKFQKVEDFIKALGITAEKRKEIVIDEQNIDSLPKLITLEYK